MRKPLALFAAASLSAGVFAFLGYDNSVFGKDDQQKAADTSGSGSSSSSSSGLSGSSASGGLNSSSSSSSQSGSLPQGVTKATQTDEQGVRQAISQVVAAICKDDGINQLQNYVASNDRQPDQPEG